MACIGAGSAAAHAGSRTDGAQNVKGMLHAAVPAYLVPMMASFVFLHATRRSPRRSQTGSVRDGRLLAGADAPSDRAAQRSSHDVDDLVNVLVRVASFGRCPDAALHVVLQDEDGQRIDSGAQG